jgi:3-oxoacyl-[acyl-carrier-protein] synthase-3
LARYAHIVGWGKYLPARTMTNRDLERLVDTTDAWIMEHSGISERHIAAAKESTSTMALRAARDALEVANLDPGDLDLLIVATVTPDHLFPATACLVQDALGASKAGTFDLSAGCSGFIHGMSVASQMILAGAYDNALVIGAETLSRIIDWQDRDTCILFGDGAGAVVLKASETPGGILSFTLGSDGSGGDLLILPAGGSHLPASQETVAKGLHYTRMNGREVFRFAVRIMGQAAREAIKKANLTIEDIELFIPHQANLRIIASAANQLSVPMERVFNNIQKYGNTSAASVPIALCEAIEEGKIRPGEHVVLVAFGAGLTWGAAVVEWQVPLPVPQPSVGAHLASWLRYTLARVRSVLKRILWRLRSSWDALFRKR